MKKNKITMNKSSDGSSYVINVALEKHPESTPYMRNSGRGWISYGRKNDYPQSLAELYYNSPTHSACVDFLKMSIVGDGIDYERMNINQTDVMPNYTESWDEFIQKIAFDYALYGGYAFKIIKNNDDRTYSFFHQPFDTVRSCEKDDEGNITSFFVSQDWKNTGKYPPVELKRFGFQDDSGLRLGETQLFVFFDYAPYTEGYYPIPSYISGIRSIQTETELTRYDLRSVINNFSASGILTLNQVDDDEEKKALVENIQNLFVGSENANSLIINFKNNDDETPCTFVKIDKDAGNSVDLFDRVNDRITAKIISAHRIPSKGLVGLDLEGASLGGDGNTLNVAYNLYNKLTANVKRANVIKTINSALRYNGVDVDLILKPMNFGITQAYDNNNDENDGGTDDGTDKE